MTTYENDFYGWTQNPKEQKQQAIMQLIKKCADLPTLDQRTPDEILGYAENAMGLWDDQLLFKGDDFSKTDLIRGRA